MKLKDLKYILEQTGWKYQETPSSSNLCFWAKEYKSIIIDRGVMVNVNETKRRVYVCGHIDKIYLEGTTLIYKHSLLQWQWKVELA